ncbi:MAG: DUF3459 domain-containing protein, partial [Thermostichus sp. DG02_4_bins_136]
VLWRWYQTLIQLRKTLPALQSFERATVQAYLFSESGLALQRGQGSEQLIALLNFSPEQAAIYSGWPPGSWQKLLDSQDPQWLGSGSSLPLQTAGDPITIPAYGVGVYRLMGSSTVDSTLIKD